MIVLMKKLVLFAVFAFICPLVFSAPLYSATWGFFIDLPVSYEFVGGNGTDSFSFATPEGANFDIIVYHAGDGRAQSHASLVALVEDIQRRLNNSGDVDAFDFRGRNAFLIELDFPLSAGGVTERMFGWALAFDLDDVHHAGAGGPRAKMLALAYGPADGGDFLAHHLSALNSIAPQAQDLFAPGPISEFLYPRRTQINVPIFGLGLQAQIFDVDAEAAQSLIDREFILLTHYEHSPDWREAWQRFYRAIYRDSFYRITDIAFQIERHLNTYGTESRDFAERLLRWVQTFTYERDFEGSDFVNLVSAATEGRGDCDSRAMLWALILRKANIPSGIMVSRQFSHAMGLAELPGTGARFTVDGRDFLVAETTTDVSIGLIDQDKSAMEHWLGIVFE